MVIVYDCVAWVKNDRHRITFIAIPYGYIWLYTLGHLMMASGRLEPSSRTEKDAVCTWHWASPRGHSPRSWTTCSVKPPLRYSSNVYVLCMTRTNYKWLSSMIKNDRQKQNSHVWSWLFTLNYLIIVLGPLGPSARTDTDVVFTWQSAPPRRHSTQVVDNLW